MIAVPWSPMRPLTSRRSPGANALGERDARGSRWPMPVVVTYMPSALPRSTTLVSPVMILTPAVVAVRDGESRVLLRRETEEDQFRLEVKQ